MFGGSAPKVAVCAVLRANGNVPSSRSGLSRCHHLLFSDAHNIPLSLKETRVRIIPHIWWAATDSQYPIAPQSLEDFFEIELRLWCGHDPSLCEKERSAKYCNLVCCCQRASPSNRAMQKRSQTRPHRT